MIQQCGAAAADAVPVGRAVVVRSGDGWTREAGAGAAGGGSAGGSAGGGGTGVLVVVEAPATAGVVETVTLALRVLVLLLRCRRRTLCEHAAGGAARTGMERQELQDAAWHGGGQGRRE